MQTENCTLFIPRRSYVTALDCQWCYRGISERQGEQIFVPDSPRSWRLNLTMSLPFQLPHKSLYVARFLRPFKPFVQKHITCDKVDEKVPCCLDPQPIRDHPRERLVYDSFVSSFTLVVTALLRQFYRYIHAPYQPWDDEVPWLHQRCSYKRQRRRE